MARDHFIPASLIGRFSDDTDRRARDRRVYVQRRDANGPRLHAADQVAAVNNLYNRPGLDVDSHWKSYESELPAALDALHNWEPLPLLTWLTPLVTHVASAFVRGREFDRRYTRRMLDQGEDPQFIDAKTARMIEFHMLLAPVMTARWVVMHFANGTSIINNDLGFCGTLDRGTKQRGWAFPLDSATLLGLFPRPKRPVGNWRNGQWFANIEHVSAGKNETAWLNRQLAGWSSEFIYGRRASLVTPLRQDMTSGETTDARYRFPLDGATAARAEHAWSQITAAAARNVAPDELRAEWAGDTYASANHPAVPLVLTAMERTEIDDSIVKTTGNAIRIDLEAAFKAGRVNDPGDLQPQNAFDYFTEQLPAPRIITQVSRGETTEESTLAEVRA